MQSLKELGIPRNFEQLLPELKQKTLQWETVCYSNTEANTSAKISSYHNLDGKSRGTFVLVPGLGSNSDEMNPLGKAISYWGITHKYNIITIDTFLGDFQPCPPEEEIKKRTFSEFIEILTHSMDFVEPYITNNYSCIVGHCAAANGIMTVFNNKIKKKNPITYKSAMFFAPWPTVDQNYSAMFHRMMFVPQDKILTPQERLKIDHFTYLAKMSEFENQLSENTKQFDFKTMAQWGIKSIIITGGQDRVIPIKQIQDKYQNLKEANPNADINYVCFPNLKHSFSGIDTCIVPAIQLIKTQRQKQR